MGFDTNGTYTRWNGPDTWQNDATAGTKILADRHDQHDDDLASALSRALLRDGTGGATANISMAGFKIINHGPTTNPTDVATKGYVDGVTGWDKSKYIGGADLDGRLNFTNITGTNGVTWTNASMAFVGRVYKASEASQRLSITDTHIPNTTTGLGDIFTVDDGGHVNTQSGTLTHNLSYVDGGWRTITPGWGSKLNFTSGDLRLASNDIATITNNYAVATMRDYFAAQNSAGSSVVSLIGSASGKQMAIWGMLGAERRWAMYLGDGAAESSTKTGSNFQLISYDNTGATPVVQVKIERLTNKVTFAGEVVTTNLTTTDPLMTVGPSTAGSTFGMQRPITTGSFTIYGGQSGATGAYMTLYGEGQSGSGRDIVLGTEATYRYFFDHSANTHYWANNAGTQVFRLSATGATVPGTLNVTGITTLSGAVNVTGLITASNLAVTDPLITMGPVAAGTAFAMQRTNVNASFHLYGGLDPAGGSYLSLYGNSFATNGGDIILGTHGAYRYFFDYSANIHYWANNAGAAVMQLSSTGLTVTGTVNVTGAASFVSLAITDTSIQVGPSTSASVFQMVRTITDGYTSIYGGTSAATGAYLHLFGNAHSAQGNDIVAGSASVARWFYDYSVGQHSWSHAAQLMRVNATEGLVVAGHVTSAGNVTSSQNFISSTAVAILSADPGGQIRLMPDGTGDSTSQMTVTTAGTIQVCNAVAAAGGGVQAGRGLLSKPGYQTAYGTNWMNMAYTSSAIHLWVDATDGGKVQFQALADTRAMRDVAPLGSVWDRIKALNPISFKRAAFGDLSLDGDDIHWGFAAPEIATTLEQGVDGADDDDLSLQTLNPMPLVAALTKGLQEAIARIEALEAA